MGVSALVPAQVRPKGLPSDPVGQQDESCRSSKLSSRHPTFAGVSSSITAGFPTKVLMWLVEERVLMFEPGGGVAEASSLAWSAWESESP
jgi:hypothetical protein